MLKAANKIVSYIQRNHRNLHSDRKGGCTDIQGRFAPLDESGLIFWFLAKSFRGMAGGVVYHDDEGVVIVRGFKTRRGQG